MRTSRGDFFYNGCERKAAYQRSAGNRPVSMGDLGVEHIAEKAFVCHGILLDAPKLRGVNPLPIPRDTRSPGIVTADGEPRLSRLGAAQGVQVHVGPV